MVMDRERIISLLEEMSDYFKECRTNASLGSKAENHFWELQVAAHDAATTLEEQEQVEIKKTLEDAFGLYGGVCPKCHNWIQSAHSFCGFCGQAVKWE